MQINFTGIKNIGYENTSFNHKTFEMLQESKNDYLSDYDEYGPNYISEEGHFLNIQLKDDYRGNHMTGFKQALEKSGLSFSEYKNPINKDFLNILITDDVYEQGNALYRDNDFYINDKEVELNDKTLPLFSYLGKLITEIKDKPAKDFIVNRDYLDSDDASKGLMLGGDMRATWKDDYDTVIEEDHSPMRVKKGAKDMNNLFTQIMMKYFGI